MFPFLDRHKLLITIVTINDVMVGLLDLIGYYMDNITALHQKHLLHLILFPSLGIIMNYAFQL